ncbi:MAG: hypothetical protein A3D19_00840 [Deltaproteobacteria bacterium RIFCSPHIGHO2_02_FULL_38_15]|nr:MAG: hypothetical protein A3D19_00840 [Deltaproteobacteria bacterium RIFCSPHIGHO2_02_FULL_38_15]HBQ20614.1 hypothetical protein [Deltaproteobacteria bacterium]
MKKLFILFFLWILAFAGMTIVAQDLFAQDSIFDEGVDTTIRPEDITQDLYQWAQNTALKLKKVLEDMRNFDLPEKRAFLIKHIQESVEEAQNIRELLLMRFALNRALDLNKSFSDQDDELSVNYVLIPVIRQAIALYEREDLPYLTATLNQQNIQDIPVPSYAAFTKNNISYLLNISNLTPSYVSQFEILKNTIVWVVNDLLRSSETKRNPINSTLILNLEELYFKYENTPIENIDYVLNNKIRSALLKTQHTMAIEKNAKEMPPFILYTPPNHTSDSTNSPFTHQLPEKPKEPGILQRIFEKRVIEQKYSQNIVNGLSIGIGFGKIDAKNTEEKTEKQETVLHLPLEFAHYRDPRTGLEGYIIKSEFDITQGQFITQNTKILGGQYLWESKSNGFWLGPYANLLTLKRDELRNLESKHWIEVGLAMNFQPFQNERFFIHAKVYGHPYDLYDDENGNYLDLNHTDILGNATSEWKTDLGRLNQDHYNSQTAGIQASEAKRDALLATGEYHISTEISGRQWVVPNSGRGAMYKVSNDGDRNTLLAPDGESNRFEKYGFVTLEMTAEWIKSFRRQDDLILQFGGHLTNIHVDGYDNDLPQIYRNQYSNRATEKSTFFTLRYRLRDNESCYLDPRNAGPLNMGPVLVISYETLDNPLAKNLMSFFNPDAASRAITKTEQWSMYVQFSW